MPMQEVWVEPEYTKKQTAAIAHIVKLCRSLTRRGLIPSEDADELDRALRTLIEEFPEAPEREEFVIDKRYREWLAQKTSAT